MWRNLVSSLVALALQSDMLLTALCCPAELVVIQRNRIIQLSTLLNKCLLNESLVIYSDLDPFSYPYKYILFVNVKDVKDLHVLLSSSSSVIVAISVQFSDLIFVGAFSGLALVSQHQQQLLSGGYYLIMSRKFKLSYFCQCMPMGVSTSFLISVAFGSKFCSCKDYEAS